MKEFFNPEEGIIIPPGYQLANLPTNDLDELSLSEHDLEKLRFSYRQRLAYFFDCQNVEYQIFLENCRLDTQYLEKALLNIYQKRNLPIWPMRKNRPVEKKHFRRVQLIIRPPFFKSAITKTADNRMQRDNHNDLIMLHLDQAKRIQTVRWWSVPQSEPTEFQRNVFRHFFSAFLAKDRDFFQQYYGQWDILADKIADHLVNCLELEKRSQQQSISEP